MNFVFVFKLLLLSCLPKICLALDIANLADTLYAGGSIVARVIHIASFVSGAVFVAASIAGYREHQRNPKFVPLGKPILFFVLGLTLLVLPYLGRFMGETGNPYDKAHQNNKKLNIYTVDPDAPLK